MQTLGGKQTSANAATQREKPQTVWASRRDHQQCDTCTWGPGVPAAAHINGRTLAGGASVWTESRGKAAKVHRLLATSGIKRTNNRRSTSEDGFHTVHGVGLRQTEGRRECHSRGRGCVEQWTHRGRGRFRGSCGQRHRMGSERDGAGAKVHVDQPTALRHSTTYGIVDTF